MKTPTLLFFALTSMLATSWAGTLIHNEGFVTFNEPLPATPPEAYASNADESSAYWSAIPGGWGVTGTPDIALTWDGEGGSDSGNGLDTYTDWDGRGNVIQIDDGLGGTRHSSVTFTPAATVGVHIGSFALDGWAGSPKGPFEVEWAITDVEGNVLVSGTWNRPVSGGRDTISPAYTGDAGQTLVLKFNQTEGDGTYLALDDLFIDQVTDATVPAPLVASSKAQYEPGETITIAFAHGPGNTKDWVAVYPVGITPGGDPPSTLWAYTDGTESGQASVTSGAVNFIDPQIEPGFYNAWLLENDGYTPLAGPVEFSVGIGAPPAWLVDTIRPRHAVAGTEYSALISAYVTYDSETSTFALVEGPSWLTVASDGQLVGTPSTDDVGLNRFTIRVTGNTSGITADVPLEIEVFKPGAEAVTRFNAMSYNAWHRWTQINDGFEKGIESIILSGADIIGLQESSEDHSQEVADALGWFRATGGDGSRQLVSRYPIIETFTAGNAVGARIRLTQSPERDVIVYSCHLDSSAYGPYAAQIDGATEASVLEEEAKSQRLSQIQSILQNMAGHLATADSAPVLLMGDFNAPSHLDWTAETASVHYGVGPVAWPVSTAVEEAGFLDSFRDVHPDPLANPGNTWSPIQKDPEPQDRIDFVYFSGSSLRALASRTFTTEVEVTIGAWGSPIGPVVNNTWPSDHAAVLTTFAIEAVDSDEDGLDDAWEQTFFDGQAANPEADANQDGLTNLGSMILGISPVGSVAAPLGLVAEEGNPERIDFSVSDRALGRELTVERSIDLHDWQTLWSFDADPAFANAHLLSTTHAGAGVWNISLEDPLADPADERAFYRLSWTR